MSDKRKILVTGGTGFIGSHTVVELISKGYDVIIADDLSNSRIEVVDAIRVISNGIQPLFIQMDLCDRNATLELFQKYKPHAVIHFAAKKLVGESVSNPLLYYRNNIDSLLNVIEGAMSIGCYDLVFSSSCTVYGQPDVLPVNEFAPPQGAPANLMPIITQVAIGKRESFSVFGTDYNTPDGTCVRDYIHVVDVAKAHVAAIERLHSAGSPERFEVFNLGTGIGISVFGMINAFERVNALKLNYKITDRRPGDVEQVWADTSLANKVLNWKAEKSLDEMVASAWAWEKALAKKTNSQTSEKGVVKS